MTAATRTAAYASEAARRQVCWTRLGNALGYTNTEAKRSEIRNALAHMAWLEPAQLAGVLDTAPTRQVIASLFYGRAWALHSAAVATLPADAAGRDRALIGLAAVTGERYVLLHVGYEVIELLHDTPAPEGVAR
jgi:hypothetical protein